MSTINDVLRDELWAGQTGEAVSKFLATTGMKLDQTTVSGWKRSRQPSLDQLAQIETAHGLPRGWVLWRAGYTDLVGLANTGDQAPTQPQTVVPSPQQMWQDFKDLREVVNELIGEIDSLADDLNEMRTADQSPD